MKWLLLLLLLVPNFTQAYPNGPQSSIITVRTLYASTNVGTVSWVTLVPSVSKAVTSVYTFDSGAQTMALGDFDSTCTTMIQAPLMISPGGNGWQSWATSKGDCIRIIALSNTASTGESDVNLFY